MTVKVGTRGEGMHLDLLVTLLLFWTGKMSLRLPSAGILYSGRVERKNASR